jgi:hypothetical protein
MAARPLYLVAYILVAAAVVLSVYAWYLMEGEPEPDPFHITMVVSDTGVNQTDGNLTDVIIWVAVANGEPKPRWSDVEVMLESPEGNGTLAPPQLRIDDQDGNGRVTEGDLLRLNALASNEMEGDVTLVTDGRAIGTVSL